MGSMHDSATDVVHEHAPDVTVLDRLEEYLRAILMSFQTESEIGEQDGGSASDTIFRLLTSRRYSYLGRGRSETYRKRVIPWIEQAVSDNQPVAFYYDLGGGYRASLRPGQEGLFFNVGLGELFALRQIALFCSQLRQYYSPGANFCIVIDNLCAYFTNDISIQRTSDYANQFRRLIAQLGLGDRVSLLLESEQFSPAEFSGEFARTAVHSSAVQPSPSEHENVQRFLGRLCELDEARTRIERYARADAVTERLIAPSIRGIRLTQRATPQTICFRSFPGGDQRIQSGEMALSFDRDADGRFQPLLLTSRNVDRYRRLRLKAPASLPPIISEIVLAEPLRSTEG